VKQFSITSERFHKSGVGPDSALKLQIFEDFERLPECIRDVGRFLPRPDHRLYSDFFRTPFDVAMKFTFLELRSSRNDRREQFPQQLVIFDRVAYRRLLLFVRWAIS
jgi:hypothetical protein